MERYSKMSELANTEVKDSQTVRILLCYLLQRLNKPVESEQLYDIAVTTGIINYFMYQDAMDYLIKNKSVKAEQNENNIKTYSLTKKGINGVETLSDLVPISYRDNIITAALKYFAGKKIENEVKIEYIKLEKGYYVHCRCLDIGDDLLDLKLFAPDLIQAEMIGKKIMLDPAGFYGKIMDIALSNEEEKFNPDDL